MVQDRVNLEPFELMVETDQTVTLVSGGHYASYGPITCLRCLRDVSAVVVMCATDFHGRWNVPKYCRDCLMDAIAQLDAALGGGE